MRQKIVVGNWKMYTTATSARQLAKAIVEGMDNERRVAVAVCPPFPYLALVGERLKGSRVALGAQNLFPEFVLSKARAMNGNERYGGARKLSVKGMTQCCGR